MESILMVSECAAFRGSFVDLLFVARNTYAYRNESYCTAMSLRYAKHAMVTLNSNLGFADALETCQKKKYIKLNELLFHIIIGKHFWLFSLALLVKVVADFNWCFVVKKVTTKRAENDLKWWRNERYWRLWQVAIARWVQVYTKDDEHVKCLVKREKKKVRTCVLTKFKVKQYDVKNSLK
jgi:hypothetical protein